jgi:hypothetical protein
VSPLAVSVRARFRPARLDATRFGAFYNVPSPALGAALAASPASRSPRPPVRTRDPGLLSGSCHSAVLLALSNMQQVAIRSILCLAAVRPASRSSCVRSASVFVNPHRCAHVSIPELQSLICRFVAVLSAHHRRVRAAHPSLSQHAPLAHSPRSLPARQGARARPHPLHLVRTAHASTSRRPRTISTCYPASRLALRLAHRMARLRARDHPRASPPPFAPASSPCRFSPLRQHAYPPAHTRVCRTRTSMTRRLSLCGGRISNRAICVRRRQTCAAARRPRRPSRSRRHVARRVPAPKQAPDGARAFDRA